MDCLEGIKNIAIPDLIIADPPYEFQTNGGGVHAVGHVSKRGHNLFMQEIEDDGINKFDFDKYIPRILDLQKDKVNAYFFCNKVLVPKYLNEAVKRGLLFDILTLNKKNPLPCKDSCYLPEIEYIIFLRSKGVFFNGNLNYRNYFKSFTVIIGERNKHPTQKPVELIKRFIKISSKKNDLILDMFMGSGTTAVASKQLNRNFIGFEILEKYILLAEKRLKQSNFNDWFKQREDKR